MDKTFKDISETPFYPKIISDYLKGNPALIPFYNYPPVLSSFKNSIADFEKTNFKRDLLADVLLHQNSGIIKQNAKNRGEKEFQNPETNINLIRQKNTFTVCTGHQLCLFTGPLFFIYKIISTINLSEELKLNYPEFNFVPVFWMASEDHDFSEINHVHLFGKKYEWQIHTNESISGNKNLIPAGNISPSSLKKIIEEIKLVCGDSENAQQLIKIFSEAYLGNINLADATRFLVNTLFGKYGLVIIDGNDKRLKSKFFETMLDDMVNQTNFSLVNSTCRELIKLSYKPQVNPREINLFYIHEHSRIRIEKEEGINYQEIIKIFPERFSPNVVLRPLYQQLILPNIAYVGGPNEIAYWFEYKKMFEYHKVNFPVLMVRGSVMWVDKKSGDQMKKLGMSPDKFFSAKEEIETDYLKNNTPVENNFDIEKENLKILFDGISKKAEKTDLSLMPAVEAELQRMLNSLEQLEKKFIKSGKQKNEVQLNQIKKLKEKFFPENKLQERFENFIPYYLKYGNDFFNTLKKELNCLDFRLLILKEEN